MARRADPITPVINDMSKLTGDRLRRVIADCGDTAARAGLDDDTVSKIIVTGLLVEVISGALSMGLGRVDYLRICLLAYDELVATLNRVREGSGPTRTA